MKKIISNNAKQYRKKNEKFEKKLILKKVRRRKLLSRNRRLSNFHFFIKSMI